MIQRMSDAPGAVPDGARWRYEDLRHDIAESAKTLSRVPKSRRTAELLASVDRLQASLSRDPHPPAEFSSWLRYEERGRPGDAIRAAALAVAKVLTFEDLLEALERVVHSDHGFEEWAPVKEQASSLSEFLQGGGRLTQEKVEAWSMAVARAGGERSDGGYLASKPEYPLNLVNRADELIRKMVWEETLR